MITRVKVTEPFNTYYEGVPQSYEAGDVLEGPIADFLYVGGSAVEPINDAEDDGGSEDGNAPKGNGSTSEPEPGVPEGSAKDVLEWVGDDPDRATAAIEAEQGKDKPRTTLLADLGKIAEA